MNTHQLLLLHPLAMICLLCCSCATHRPFPLRLPAEISFNEGAGRGEPLFVTLRLENGEELLFLVDTGSTYTVLDKSLEPQLGRRLKIASLWAPKPVSGFHKPPRLYLGNTRLVTGNKVATMDLKSFLAGRGLTVFGAERLGILGMDCLRHYCLQLDFAENKLRFLDSGRLNAGDLGQAYPLTGYRGCFAARENLVGVKGQKSLIDTGCNFDGLLTPKLFERWTNQVASGALAHEARFPNGVFGGITYTNLSLHAANWGNLVGLTFLARNLVTLNFPDQMMYLKRQNAGSNRHCNVNDEMRNKPPNEKT